MIKLFLLTLITYFVLLMFDVSLDFSDLKTLQGYKLFTTILKDLMQLCIVITVIILIYLRVHKAFNL